MSHVEAGSLGGLKSSGNMTPAQRTARARVAGLASADERRRARESALMWAVEQRMVEVVRPAVSLAARNRLVE
jgi:hypothetical protein